MITAPATRRPGRPKGHTYTLPDHLAETYMTVKQSAAFLGCTERHVYKLMEQGRIVGVQYLSHRLFTKASLKLFQSAELGIHVPPTKSETATKGKKGKS